MAAYVTFAGLTVPVVEIIGDEPEGADSHRVTVKCRTEEYAYYVALAALYGKVNADRLESGKTKITTVGGTLGTLVIGSLSYTNCYIEALSNAQASGSVPFDFSDDVVWEFTIKFIQDTST